MEYTYTCVLEREDDWWLARFPQLGNYVTQGHTREEALREAHDLLTLLLCGIIEDGEYLPDPGQLLECSLVTVDITPEVIEETHYTTQTDAAEMLGVTRARVNALVASGQLDSKEFNGRRKVSLESVNRYAAAERKAGRPKATVA